MSLPVRSGVVAVCLAMLVAGRGFAADFADAVIGATFKLYHPDSTSACMLVSRGQDDTGLYLVTTAHTLERTKGESVLLVLREKTEAGAHRRHDHKILVRRGKEALWPRHPEEDVAALRLDGPLPLPVQGLPVSALADGRRLAEEGLGTCSPLFVLSYPHRFEANDAAFPVARQGIIASHPFPAIVGKPRFLADFSAYAGDSGGPVFVRSKTGEALVIGMVLARFHHDEKVKTEVEERTIHHPLGLGSVLDARIVRDTLDLAAAKPRAGRKEEAAR